AYARAQARTKLLHALPTSPDGAEPADALADRVQVARTMAHEVLKQLADEGAAGRAGTGKRGNPFRYWTAAPIHSSAIEIEVADESDAARPATTGPIHSFAT